MASDPDEGVRRELILAFRNLPSDQVGESLRKLTAAWDGQDRWYLEALGLALEKRESDFLSTLFDGSLYGLLDLEKTGNNGNVALPPYFPVDRNEAFITAGTPDQAVSPVSKYLGLAWRIHRREVLPLIERILPGLRAVALQQATDDILERMNDPQTADVVAKMAMRTSDPTHHRALLGLLTRRIGGDWNSASGHAEIVKVIEQTLSDPVTNAMGVALAVATHDRHYYQSLRILAEDSKIPEESRVAAVEGLGSFPESSQEILERLIQSVRGKTSSTPVAEAAVRTIARIKKDVKALIALLSASDFPLGLRREALRSLARLRDGGRQVLDLASAGKLPADLKNDATTLVHTDSNRRVRDQAASILPLPKTAEGQSLPSIGELIRRHGDPEKGRGVSSRPGQTRAGCHRVQGRGQWVGPDLSTIGIKYGRDELLRSILSPSDSIGYSYRSVVAALNDGRVITGLVLDDTADKLAIKTADGQRISVDPHLVEDRRTSDVSLMPEGLAQTMTTQELVDLLSYLTTLRQPVSIVGQYQMVGPVYEPDRKRQIAPGSAFNLQTPVADGRNHQLSWPAWHECRGTG